MTEELEIAKGLVYSLTPAQLLRLAFTMYKCKDELEEAISDALTDLQGKMNEKEAECRYTDNLIESLIDGTFEVSLQHIYRMTTKKFFSAIHIPNEKECQNG